jgi:hypothetical protein
MPHLARLPVRCLPHAIYRVQHDQCATAVTLAYITESAATLEERMPQWVSAIEQRMANNGRRHSVGRAAGARCLAARKDYESVAASRGGHLAQCSVHLAADSGRGEPGSVSVAYAHESRSVRPRNGLVAARRVSRQNGELVGDRGQGHVQGLHGSGMPISGALLRPVPAAGWAAAWHTRSPVWRDPHVMATAT